MSESILLSTNAPQGKDVNAMHLNLVNNIQKHRVNVAEHKTLPFKMGTDLETFLAESKKKLEEGKITPDQHVTGLRDRLSIAVSSMYNQANNLRMLLESGYNTLRFSGDYTALEAMEYFKQTKELPLTAAGIALLSSQTLNWAFESYCDEIEKTVAKTLTKIQSR